MAQYSDEDILFSALPVEGKRRTKSAAPKPVTPRPKKERMAKPPSSLTTKILDQIAAMDDFEGKSQVFVFEAMGAARQGDRARYDQLLSKASSFFGERVPHVPDFDSTQAWKPKRRRGGFVERVAINFGESRGED